MEKKEKIIMIVSVTLGFLAFLFLISVVVHVDDDKACGMNGGNWNEIKSHCEDVNGN
jgi:hypothetical protein